MGTSAALDESVGIVGALASAALGAPELGLSLALESSISLPGGAPYMEAQFVVATAAPTVPAANSAARDRRPAIVRLCLFSTTLAVAPQNGQVASPRLT